MPRKLTAQSRLCDDFNSFEKGTPVERQGRKATGLRARPMTAGLPIRIAGCDSFHCRGQPLTLSDSRSNFRLALLLSFADGVVVNQPEPAMSANVNTLRNSGIFSRRKIAKPTVVRPTTFRDLQEYLDPSSNYLAPFRPMGAGSSSTDCSASTAGTVIDMCGMDQIIKIDAYADTVTVQAGVRLHQLVDALAEERPRTCGNFDLMNRTVGGAVASGCIGPIDERPTAHSLPSKSSA